MPVWVIREKELAVGDRLDGGRFVVEVKKAPRPSAVIMNHHAREWDAANPVGTPNRDLRDKMFSTEERVLASEEPVFWGRVSYGQCHLPFGPP
jgi:hypothetical protein